MIPHKLGTPISRADNALGKNISQLRFLNLFLSDAPALSLEVSLYQRLMLADQLAVNERIADQPAADRINDEIQSFQGNLADQDGAIVWNFGHFA